MRTTSKRIIRGTALAVALACATGWAQAADTTDDGIAAVVGDQVITRYDLALRVQAAEQQLGHEGQTVPPTAQLRAQVLDQLVTRLALAEFAESSGIEVDKATLDQAVAQVASGYGMTADQLRDKLKASGMDWNAYREQIKDDILIGRLRQRDVAGRVKVSDQEIDDYLRARKDQGPAANAPITLAQIFVPVASGASQSDVEKARQRIDDIMQQLKSGKNFAALARQTSTGPDARDGGKLGTRPASDWPALFMDAIHGLSPGQVSQVIRSPAGFHILQLVEGPPAAPAEGSAMQAQVREIVIDTDGNAAKAVARKELDQIREAIASGKVSFADKARELSQDIPSAKRGGDIGWVLPGELPAALDSALNRLNPGDISEPIVLPDRVVLLQLVDRREHALDTAQERAVARNVLLQRKEEREFEDFVKDVRARTYVRIPDSNS